MRFLRCRIGVVVIYEGRIVADLPREQVTVQQIGAFMAGTQIEH